MHGRLDELRQLSVQCAPSEAQRSFLARAPSFCRLGRLEEEQRKVPGDGERSALLAGDRHPEWIRDLQDPVPFGCDSREHASHSEVSADLKLEVVSSKETARATIRSQWGP